MNNQSLYIAIGYTCNHSCKFCPRGIDKNHSSLQNETELLAYIDKILMLRDIKHVTVSGGEPTLQPYFLKIMKKLANKNLNVELLSNSDRFSDCSLVKKLIDVFPKENLSVTTAIHSHIAQIHEYITSSKGSFQRSILGLHNLEKYNISINIKYVINNYSYKKLPYFVDWVASEFPKAFFLTITGMDLCGMTPSIKKEAAVSNTSLEPYLEEAIAKYEFYKEKGLKIFLRLTDFPLCHVDPLYWKYFEMKNISSNAYLAPTIKNEIYANLELKSECDTFYLKCKNCNVQEICPGSWRTHYEYFGESDVEPITLKLETYYNN